ncbi:MAG: DNA/RNA nuclease SfsA [Desulfobacula sp.]|nr:DNA/RNA nuclease SfsA [Desulfobacula sp.]
MKDEGFILPPLVPGTLVKRYKRFLADVVLETGEMVTVHCPNSGSMKGCALPGSRVFLSQSDNPGRKYRHTWELIEVPGTLVGINTQVPNKLVKRAVEKGLISELSGYGRVSAEVKTSAHTRLDLVLEQGEGLESREDCYVEIKNCTLVEEGRAMFPDAVTERGQKHLQELEHLVSLGHRGVIFFLIQRMDAASFSPADKIDKAYGEKLRKAVQNGVEIVTRDTVITTERIKIGRALPVIL